MMLTWISSMVSLVIMVTMTQCESLPTCDKTSTCSCHSEDGVIDLSPLDGKGTPGLSAPGVTYTYYYNPCTPFTIGLCSNAAICEVIPDSGYQRETGLHSTAEFLSVDDVLTIKMEDSVLYVTSLVKLVCDHNHRGTFQLLKDEYPTYTFQLTSKYACPVKAPTTVTTATTTITDITTAPPTPAPTPDCGSCFVLVIFLMVVVILLLVSLILALVAYSRKPAANLQCQHCLNAPTERKSDGKYARF